MKYSEHLVIPDGVPVGQIAGKRGGFFKSIKQQTTSSVWMNSKTRIVTIKGSESAVQRASVLIRAHVQAISPQSTIPPSVCKALPPLQKNRRRAYVAIPEGMPIGHLIGKNGRNFKYIKVQTKAHLWINTEARTVSILGSQQAVERADDMLRVQFVAHEEGKAMPYAHTQGGFVLGQALSANKEIMFVEREWKTSTCMHFKEPGFEIMPAPEEASPSSAKGADQNNVVNPDDVVGGSGSTKNMTTEEEPVRAMVVWSELSRAIEAHTAVLLKGIGDHSGILKFNFGKQMFYGPNVPASRMPIQLAEFCDTFCVDRLEGYRAYYVNALPENEAKGLGEILHDSFSFNVGARQFKVVEKLIDQRSNIGHAVFYDLPDGLDGKLELQACEAAATPLGFLPIVCGGRECGIPDVRFKMKGFTSSDSHQENPELVAFAKDALLVDGKLVFDSNKYISDASRVETVTPYKGQVGGRDVTVNVTHVGITEKGKKLSHWQVTGILDIPPLISAEELMDLVTFTLVVAAKLPGRLPF